MSDSGSLSLVAEGVAEGAAVADQDYTLKTSKPITAQMVLELVKMLGEKSLRTLPELDSTEIIVSTTESKLEELKNDLKWIDSFSLYTCYLQYAMH